LIEVVLMSLANHPIPEIPPETARVARAAFPRGNPWLQLRDQLGAIYQDQAFVALFASVGQPAVAPWRLALVTLLQFAEGVTDRQAADAVRSRLDWKYLLALPLADPGFDASVLCEFRERLVTGDAAALFLERVLDVCRQHKWLKVRGHQRTDATHVVAAARLLTRLELVTATLQQAFNVLATVDPAWVVEHCPAEWGERYGARLSEFRLPQSAAARVAWAEQVGADGHQLLDWLWSSQAPTGLRQLSAIETLRRIWVQQFCSINHRWRWREADKEGVPPAAVALRSPFDTEARYAEKRGAGWLGYKVHLTETCDLDVPRLITQVTTTVATTPDGAVLPAIHDDLAAHTRLPKAHLVDAGYISAANLDRSQREHQIALCGPPLADTAWQARAGEGFAASDFKLDWEKHEAICPTGRRSQSWRETTNQRGLREIKLKFARGDCRACGVRVHCTRTAEQRRSLTIPPETEFKALAAARERTKHADYKALYALRAGSEGSLSQAVRRSGLRRARYIGLTKTHLQNVLTATAVNLVRLLGWLADTSVGRTPQSAFAKLLCPVPVTA
jgi:transposase